MGKLTIFLKKTHSVGNIDFIILLSHLFCLIILIKSHHPKKIKRVLIRIQNILIIQKNWRFKINLILIIKGL
jgi:hypothetical protein